MTHLGRFIKTLRQDRLRMSQREFGDAIGVTRQHISQAEHGRQGLSAGLMEEIAKKFGRDESDRKALLLSLRDAAYRDRVPGGAESLQADHRYLDGAPPPEPFLAEVKRDVSQLGVSSEQVSQVIGVPAAAWELFLAGRFNLRREQVSRLARYLGGDAEAYYLPLAGYLPLDLARILGEDISRARTLMKLTSLPPDRVDDVFRTMRVLTEGRTQSSQPVRQDPPAASTRNPDPEGSSEE